MHDLHVDVAGERSPSATNARTVMRVADLGGVADAAALDVLDPDAGQPARTRFFHAASSRAPA